MISTRYLFRVDTGFLVRKCWELTGFSPGERCELSVSLVRGGHALGVRLGAPDFCKESVTFA